MVLSVAVDVLISGYEPARYVVAHEMCHLAVRAGIYAPPDKGPVSHSAQWVDLAERVGVRVTDQERAEANATSSATGTARSAPPSVS